MNRRTLAAPARVAGTGLFTAAPAILTIEPAPAGSGLLLLAPGWPDPCPASIAHQQPAHPHPAFAAIPPRCTAIAPEGHPPVFTVEHALAALAGLGVTDALLRLNAHELPIDDGSALAFVQALRAAGLRDLPGTLEPLHPTRAITVEDAGASITIEPADAPHYEYHLDFAGRAPIAPHTASWDADPDDFARRIAPARTFSFAREVHQMRGLGLFAGFTAADLLVIDDAGTPIDNAWRSPDEPALHKLLDLIGDLALAGAPICARITARRSGHALNHAAARALRAEIGL